MKKVWLGTTTFRAPSPPRATRRRWFSATSKNGDKSLVTKVELSRFHHSEPAVQFESQNSLHRNFDRPFGQNLGDRTCPGAGTGADCRSLAAAGDRADDCSHRRASAHELAGARVAADAAAALHRN